MTIDTYSFQDTLLADGGKQYYSNCYIAGAVDYIYGDASAWFGECTLGGVLVRSMHKTLSMDCGPVRMRTVHGQ